MTKKTLVICTKPDDPKSFCSNYDLGLFIPGMLYRWDQEYDSYDQPGWTSSHMLDEAEFEEVETVADAHRYIDEWADKMKAEATRIIEARNK